MSFFLALRLFSSMLWGCQTPLPRLSVRPNSIQANIWSLFASGFRKPLLWSKHKIYIIDVCLLFTKWIFYQFWQNMWSIRICKQSDMKGALVTRRDCEKYSRKSKIIAWARCWQRWNFAYSLLYPLERKVPLRVLINLPATSPTCYPRSANIVAFRGPAC